jgi:hypothetical protein
MLENEFIVDSCRIADLDLELVDEQQTKFELEIELEKYSRKGK